jgi:ferredoxin
MPDYRIEIDRDVCIGASTCSEFAPKTFSNDSDGLVILLDVSASSREEIEAAEQNCPSGAIRMVRGT